MCRGRLVGHRGLWAPDRRQIWVDSRLCDGYAAPVLAHELTHVRRGDDGPQSRAVEEWIDEEWSIKLGFSAYVARRVLTAQGPGLMEKLRAAGGGL